MSTNGLALTATKSMGMHLIPAATLAIGGFLVWKLWQQQQKIKHNEQTLDQLQQAFAKQQDQQQPQPAIKKEAPQSTASFFNPSPSLAAMDKNTQTQKRDLFAQLLDENIALRKPH